MAGDWIKMRHDLADDPAVIGMAARLGLDEFAVVGRLHHLWVWADKQSRDGHAASVTFQWIDRKVQRDGFAQAMSDAGWLEETDTGILFPRFERHNGDSAKKRALGANRQQKSRSGHAQGDAPVVRLVTAEASDQSRTQRDESVTREEKRREERNTPPTPQGGMPGFAAFWLAWPTGDRKQAKGKCFEAWKKAGAEPHAALIVAHVERMKRSTHWTKDDGQFVPAPLVYLNQRRWEGTSDEQPLEPARNFV